jgi:glutathione synthase/RimK-type ligase-like ATP-grasp enzyme
VKLALATSEQFPHLPADDSALVRALQDGGVHPEAVVWSEPTVDWCRFDAVLIRSCWDYHLRTSEFLEWVQRLDALGVSLFNPPALIRWNVEKHYLRDLASRGAPVLTTIWLPRGATNVELPPSWSRVVVKPVVSLSAHDTWLLDVPLDEHGRSRLARMLDTGDVLVQPFVPEIRRYGEMSFVFIDGTFSHAARKRPRPRDFRVQEQHGGRSAPARPSSRHVQTATGVLALLPTTPLYARIDAIVYRDQFRLMEAELIEPELFFRFAPTAATKLARALIARVPAAQESAGRGSRLRVRSSSLERDSAEPGTAMRSGLERRE